MSIRTYSELIKINSFEERYKYLELKGSVGVSTFGFDRAFNQMFYLSEDWKRVRREVIIRDNGCDLGFPGCEILGSKIMVHHMNPISIDDIVKRTDILLNPEFLITTFHQTHNAIHFGDKNLLAKPLVERSRNDTCPWKM